MDHRIIVRNVSKFNPLFNQDNAMKVKVTAWKNNYEGLAIVLDGLDCTSLGWIRLTESAEVELQDLSQDVIINAELNSIDEELKKITDNALRKVDELEQRKKDFWSLVHIQ